MYYLEENVYIFFRQSRCLHDSLAVGWLLKPIYYILRFHPDHTSTNLTKALRKPIYYKFVRLVSRKSHRFVLSQEKVIVRLRNTSHSIQFSHHLSKCSVSHSVHIISYKKKVGDAIQLN